MDSIKTIVEAVKGLKTIASTSAVTPSGAIVEMLYHRAERKTAFAVWESGAWKIETAVKLDPFHEIIPYSAHNNLVTSEVVLFPEQPVEYESEETLLQEIQAFIHRYVDVSPFFEKLASYYVLLSWLYDGFNELPYLRVRGDPGSGKTRFLLTVGSICYKPIFASGASTVSPLFRMLDAIRGTLIIDESDFRFSDEKAELTKILNNGNAQGFPVLRSEVSPKGEYNPRAYHVFGPKIVATRGFFDDRALESRFLTEEMGQRRLRDDVPINLSATHKEEALHLRNKLLLFRFRNFKKQRLSEAFVDRSIEPRLNQIFAPLLSIVTDSTVKEELREVLRQYHRDLLSERSMDTEAHILEVIQSLLAAPETTKLSISDITSRFADLYGTEYDRKVTAKWLGWVIRNRIGLKPQRSREGYIIPRGELSKLSRLYEKYGLNLPEPPDSTSRGEHVNLVNIAGG